MTAAFIVTLEVDSVDPNSLTEDALLVEEALQDVGLDVLSVEPWARRGMSNEPPMSAPPIVQGGVSYGLTSLADVLPEAVRPNLSPIKPIE